MQMIYFTVKNSEGRNGFVVFAVAKYKHKPPKPRKKKVTSPPCFKCLQMEQEKSASRRGYVVLAFLLIVGAVVAGAVVANSKQDALVVRCFLVFFAWSFFFFFA